MYLILQIDIDTAGFKYIIELLSITNFHSFNYKENPVSFSLFNNTNKKEIQIKNSTRIKSITIFILQKAGYLFIKLHEGLASSPHPFHDQYHLVLVVSVRQKKNFMFSIRIFPTALYWSRCVRYMYMCDISGVWYKSPLNSQNKTKPEGLIRWKVIWVTLQCTINKVVA